MQAWQVELYRQVGQVCGWGSSFPSAGSEEEAKARGLSFSKSVKLGPGSFYMETLPLPDPYAQSPRRGENGRH